MTSNDNEQDDNNDDHPTEIPIAGVQKWKWDWKLWKSKSKPRHMADDEENAEIEYKH